MVFLVILTSVVSLVCLTMMVLNLGKFLGIEEGYDKAQSKYQKELENIRSAYNKTADDWKKKVDEAHKRLREVQVESDTNREYALDRKKRVEELEQYLDKKTTTNNEELHSLNNTIVLHTKYIKELEQQIESAYLKGKQDTDRLWEHKEKEILKQLTHAKQISHRETIYDIVTAIAAISEDAEDIIDKLHTETNEKCDQIQSAQPTHEQLG